MEILLPALPPPRRTMYQYPKFWASSGDFLSLPYQEIHTLTVDKWFGFLRRIQTNYEIFSQDEDTRSKPPKVLCWSLKEERSFNLETDLDVECCSSSIFDATEILGEECFGFSNRSLFAWNIKTESPTRKINFHNINVPLKSLSVRHGLCIFATGKFRPH